MAYPLGPPLICGVCCWEEEDWPGFVPESSEEGRRRWRVQGTQDSCKFCAAISLPAYPSPNTVASHLLLQFIIRSSLHWMHAACSVKGTMEGAALISQGWVIYLCRLHPGGMGRWSGGGDELARWMFCGSGCGWWLRFLWGVECWRQNLSGELEPLAELLN